MLEMVDGGTAGVFGTLCVREGWRGKFRGGEWEGKFEGKKEMEKRVLWEGGDMT